jgi:plastocyanin
MRKTWSDRTGLRRQAAVVTCWAGGLLCYAVWQAVCSAPATGALIVGKIEVPDSSSGHPRDFSRMVVFLVPEGGALPPALPANPLFMSQKRAQFNPPFLVVVKGQTVDFTNDDTIDHNVYSLSPPKKFDLGLYPKGQKETVTFDREGPVMIFCSVHAAMNAIIYVVPNRLFTAVDPSGAFAIPDVPAGRYSLRTWHPDLPQIKKIVNVRADDAAIGRPVPLKISLGRQAGSLEQP